MRWLIPTIIALSGGLAMGQDPIIHQGSNTDPNPGPTGEKPYEMAGREEPRAPLFDFTDVTGWLVEGHNAEGWLYRSEEQKLFADSCAKLIYVTRGDNPFLIARPEEPIEIPGEWDALNFWNYGNNWGWAPDPKTPQLGVSAIIRDASGWESELGLGGINYEYWYVMNARLHEDQLARIQWPAKFVGLKFRNVTNSEEQAIYLGPCSFFKEEWKPLTFEPWPDKLPFPTRDETILPINKAKHATSASREGDAYAFVYRGADCRLEYRVTPSTGTLSDIEVLYQGRAVKPCAGGEVRLATGDEVTRTLKAQALEGDTLTLVWTHAAGDLTTDITYRIYLNQKSLVVEMAADQPVVERVALGRAEPVAAPKLVRIPFLTYGWGNLDPHCLYADGLFFFTQFDWYYSDASALRGTNAIGPDWAAYNEGCQYIPKTNGERNLLRERLFINVSPDFQEVLPTIPNPASPMKDEMGDRLWRVKHGADHAAEIAEATRYRKYGAEKVAIRYHEDTWRDTGESYTFRVDAAPKRGGDEALKNLVSTVQDLGWRVGLYTNYTDYAPVNSYWDEDWVARHPNGDWMRAWMRCYAPKPMRAVEMQAKLAPQIQAKFGENHSYCDVHTAVTPFDRVDYDHRVPGAGTFRRTFECFGRLLANEKIAHNGPVYSEGLMHFWYAGLTDGNYGQLTWPAPPKAPLLVDFDLLKMHPLEMDAGMGAPGMFFRGAPPDLDQFIATTLAYGHIGYMEWGDFAGALKIYYMTQPIQQHYAMVPVKSIEYEHEGRMVDTSEAIKSGAYLKGQVLITYENGTMVVVNGSPDKIPFEMSERGVWRAVPQWGHFANAPDGTYSMSILITATGQPGYYGPRRRVDISSSPTQHYMSSRDGWAWGEQLAADGAAALKEENSAWWVIPADKVTDFAFDPKLIGESPEWRVTGYAEDGSVTDPPTVRWSRGLLHVIPGDEGALKYKIAPRDAAPPPVLSSVRLAPLGGSLGVSLPGGYSLRATCTWEVGGESREAKVVAADGRFTVDVPEDAADGAHIWLSMPVAPAETLHLDFIAVEPVGLALNAALPARLGEDETLPATATLTSNLADKSTIDLAFTLSAGTCDPATSSVTLASAAFSNVNVAVSLPREPGRYELTATATVSGREVSATRVVKAEWELPVVLDLMDPSVGVARGFRARGEDETIGLPEIYFGEYELTRARSGGEERACIFTHPPYAAGRVGYVFGKYEVELPAEHEAVLEFAMGMRDGLDATDGVTFKVAVVDSDGAETELFSRHHAALKWDDVEVDLGEFAGQVVQLKLMADCGPANDTTADHALWGNPRLVLRDEAARRLLVTEAE